MSKRTIGKVKNFFQKPSVAAIRVENDGLKVGGRIQFLVATNDFLQTIESIHIEHQFVNEAKGGDLVGIKTSRRV